MRRAARVTKRSQRSSFNNLSFEKLEDRKLLASVTFDAGIVTVRGDNTADVITLTGSADYRSFSVDVNDDPSLARTFNYSNVTDVKVFALGGDDTINNTLVRETTIYGQDGDDVIYGGWVADRIFGGNGDDTINGRNGDDYITGGSGDDLLIGSTGDDTVYGGNGNDVLHGVLGDDFLNGQAGNDIILGGDGDDSLVGSAGDDTLNGNDGLDRLNGGTGNDYLNGGADRDIISGSFGDDVLMGEGGNDYLAGNDGSDRIYGQEGADTLLGQAGDDLLDAGFDQNVDRLTGGSGLDEFVVLGNIGSDSVDVVNDRARFETYNGYSGPLTALAEVDGDTLNIRGMESRDVIYFYAVSGQSQFRVTANGEDLGTYSNSVINQVVVNGNGGNDHIDNNNRSIVPMRIDGGAGNDTIRGGRGNDILSGGEGVDVITGRDGDDEINGGAGNDRLYGYDGDDTINGDAGDDLVYGHDGDDEINGGDGDDRLYGQDDDDTINGEAGNDRIYGSNGDDVLKGALGNDRIWGGNDNDTIEGNWGHDELRGENGDDTIRGGDGDDYLHGGAHNDTLFGEAGVDELWGGGHDDILSGGTDDEVDTLWGNGGTDEFFAVRDDNVRDQSSLETSEDPVAGQTQATQDIAATELDDNQFDDFLDSLPAVAAFEVLGDLTVVNSGTQQLAFFNDGVTNRQIGSFPSSFNLVDITNISDQIVALENDGTVQALGDPSFSIVPVEALEGTVNFDPVIDFALVAAGSSNTAVIGGVESVADEFGIISQSVVPSATFQTSNSASVVSNIAGLALGRAVNNLASNSTLGILNQLRNQVLPTSMVGTLFNAVTRVAAHAAVNSLLFQDGDDVSEFTTTTEHKTIAAARTNVLALITASNDAGEKAGFVGELAVINSINADGKFGGSADFSVTAGEFTFRSSKKVSFDETTGDIDAFANVGWLGAGTGPYAIEVKTSTMNLAQSVKEVAYIDTLNKARVAAGETPFKYLMVRNSNIGDQGAMDSLTQLRNATQGTGVEIEVLLYDFPAALDVTNPGSTTGTRGRVFR